MSGVVELSVGLGMGGSWDGVSTTYLYLKKRRR